LLLKVYFYLILSTMFLSKQEVMGEITFENHIEKLNGRKNYTSWSFAIKNILIVSDLWDFVERPTEKKETLDEKTFANLDAKAKAKICLSLAPSVYPVVIGTTTAQATWKKLQETYADSGLSRQLHLLRKMFNTKLSAYQTMEMYISDIKGTQQQLVEIDSALEDELVGVIMLTGLTDEYNPLVMALENSGTKISSDSVASVLLKEDVRRAPTSSNTNSALSTKKNVPQCSYCKKFGHLVSVCRKRKCNQNLTNYTTDISLLSSFIDRSANHTSSTTWYIDSGATSHMCNNKDMFRDMTRQSNSVTVANSEKVPSEGKGTVSLHVSNNIHTISNVLFVPKLAVNLISVSSLIQKGFVVVFTSKGANILLKEGCKVSGTVMATASNHKVTKVCIS
jgi:hypothetical protein